MRTPLLIILFFLPLAIIAQEDPEFPRGGVFYLSAQHGVKTGFDENPDLFVGGVGISGQITLIPSHLRGGFYGDLAFTNKRFTFLVGPKLAWKIKTFQVKPLGSVFNLQLQAEFLKGSFGEKLLGGSVGLEIFQLFMIQVMTHRDLENQDWWFRAGLGWNLLHKKRRSATGSDPLRRQ